MTEKSTLQILIEARAKLVSGFCQGTMARTSFGQVLNPFDDRAVSWCSLGAIAAVMKIWHPENNRVVRVLDSCIPPDFKTGVPGMISFTEHCSYARVADYNNCTSKEKVLSLFDRAIAKLAPPKRPTSELVADLMTQVLSTPVVEPVAEEETA